MKKIFYLMLLCATVFLTSCKDDDPVIASAVNLDKNILSLVVGTTGTLTATITPDNVDVQDLTWMSCDEAIATVDSHGTVTAVAVGKATVTVVTVSGGKSASCVVTVTAAPVAVTGLSLDKTELSLGADDKAQLQAIIAPEDATNTNVTWTSSDDRVATVSNTGEVKGVAEGVATITATSEDGGKTATCTVTVTERPAFRFYGAKNQKMVYYDGTKLNYIEGIPYGPFAATIMIGDDYYAIDMDVNFFKNGVACAKEGKLPTTGVNRIYDACYVGNSLYTAGTDESNNATYWKDGQKLFSVSLGNYPFNYICVLGNDIFVVGTSREEIHVYKNGTEIYKYATQGSLGGMKNISGMKIYDGKVYLLVSDTDDKKCCRFVYDNTLATMVQDGVFDADRVGYFNIGGDALYAGLVSETGTKFYKNLDWSTALPDLTMPAEGYENGIDMRMIIGEGANAYQYGQLRRSDTRNKEFYCWRNSVDPIRMPADTIYCAVVHIAK